MNEEKFLRWLEKQMQEFSVREQAAKQKNDEVTALVCYGKITSMMVIKEKIESGEFE